MDIVLEGIRSLLHEKQNEILTDLELKYANYINMLLLQKAIIHSRIRADFNRITNQINTQIMKYKVNNTFQTNYIRHSTVNTSVIHNAHSPNEDKMNENRILRKKRKSKPMTRSRSQTKRRRLTLDMKKAMNKSYVSNHKLWKLWHKKEEELKDKYRNKPGGVNVILVRTLKTELKQFIISQELYDEDKWPSAWDQKPYLQMKDVLFNLCLKTTLYATAIIYQ